MALSHPFLGTLCALFLISGCSWFEPTIQLEVRPQATTVTVPAQNRSCANIPTPPNPDTATQRDVAVWLPDVYAAHNECKSDLRTVVRIIDSHNAEAARQAAENKKAAE